MPRHRIVLADSLAFLATLADESIDLIYVDPPFNTGKRQQRRRIEVERDVAGDRTGFGGTRYRTIDRGTSGWDDRFDDLPAFLAPRFEHARRVLKPDGSLFVHLDYREVHYVKVLLDRLFGRASFRNEIIWAYDYGARSKTRWPAKHDNILWYARDPRKYTFNHEAMDRIPYMAPGLVGPEKAKRGKTPTDVWWHTIVSPCGREKTGYPTQKPVRLLERIIKVHTRPGDRVLDFFAGSGTLGEAALRHDRSAVLIDEHPEAIDVMKRRLAFANPRLG